MMTGFDIMQRLYDVLTAAGAAGQVSGGVYKNTRPLDSLKEDIVINTLPVSAKQLQQGVANVNVHVPNLVVNVDGLQDATQPNLARLKAITDWLIPVIEGMNTGDSDMFIYIDRQQLFLEEETDREIYGHYMNLRLQVYMVNV